jgi:hypothetical protein
MGAIGVAGPVPVATGGGAAVGAPVGGGAVYGTGCAFGSVVGVVVETWALPPPHAKRATEATVS